MGFTAKKGFREGFSEGVLRRWFPEGAHNTPSDSTTPWACAPKIRADFREGDEDSNFFSFQNPAVQ